ncbi:MAG: TonB-dependent receptor [Bacteroidales bacterium]|nr:TonB-dependent receptor [Candidatus Cacconaster merdequi]
MHRYSFALILAISLLTVCTNAAFAQYVPDCPDSTLCLNESVVVAYRQSDKIIPAQSIRGDEIKRLGSHSVADAIRYFSGIQVKDYGGVGGLKTINVRSMGTQHVGVFYDGVQLGNAQNGQIDLGKYSLENLESITLYNGQKSSTLQSAKDYASASAVYLRAKAPSFSEKSSSHFKARLSGGSFGTFNPSVLWEQKLGKNVSSSFNAEYLNTTGKYRFTYATKDGYSASDIRRNGDVSAVRLEEGLFGTINDGEWRARVYFYDSQRGYPGAVVREEPGKFRHEDRQWDTDFFTQGSLYKQWEKYRLNASIKYSYNYLHYLSDPRPEATTMHVENRYRQQEAYASLSHEFSFFEWWDISIATDWQYNTLDADLAEFVFPSRNTLLAAMATSFNFRKIKFQASGLYTYVNDSAKSGKAAGRKKRLSPTVVLQILPFDDIDLSFRAFYKDVFRMPTLNDLYYTFVGNKNLKPESSTQYNIGVTYSVNWKESLLRNVKASVDAYYNKVNDKIIATPTSNQFQWTMINLGLVLIKGADVTLSSNLVFNDNLSSDIHLNYTFQKAQDCTNPESQWYKHQIPYIPWHSGSLSAGITYKQWNFNYSFIYTGERYNASANIPENHEQPWYTSDVSFSRTFSLWNNLFKVAAEINNLFNQQYEVVRCYPMPGTNFRLTLTMNFQL